jgi:2,3-bisphosphoglycerate-dependent phosphoglycerate mutase
MPSTRLLFVFRHGETDWNRERRLQGQFDVPLNATGLEQAEALAQRLLQHRLEAVVSSDMRRAWTTATIVAETLGIPLLPEPGLREISVGEAQGLLWEEARARFGADLTERWYSEDDVAFPGGETGGQTRTRGLEALRRVAQAQPYRRIGISTHGAMIRQLLKHALPPGATPPSAANTALHILVYDPDSERLTPAEDQETPDPFDEF